jgi:hypothetical protein
LARGPPSTAVDTPTALLPPRGGGRLDTNVIAGTSAAVAGNTTGHTEEIMPTNTQDIEQGTEEQKREADRQQQQQQGQQGQEGDLYQGQERFANEEGEEGGEGGEGLGEEESLDDVDTLEAEQRGDDADLDRDLDRGADRGSDEDIERETDEE